MGHTAIVCSKSLIFNIGWLAWSKVQWNLFRTGVQRVFYRVSICITYSSPAMYIQDLPGKRKTYPVSSDTRWTYVSPPLTAITLAWIITTYFSFDSIPRARTELSWKNSPLWWYRSLAEHGPYRWIGLPQLNLQKWLLLLSGFFSPIFLSFLILFFHFLSTDGMCLWLPSTSDLFVKINKKYAYKFQKI
jgi:hypothetical protein